MPLIENRELLALVKLLDDTDEEVLRHVTDKLTSLGPQMIPMLEEVWETAKEPIVQERLEEVISQIHFNELYENFKEWISTENNDILEGVLLVNRFMYPDQDDSRIISQLEKLYNNAWIEFSPGLSPTEEVQVINHVLYTLHGFTGNTQLSFDPDLGYIGQVLATKKGNSITLGLIYLILAQKLNVQMYGVNLPYHFVLAYCSAELDNEELADNSASDRVLFYINPLNQGAIFTRNEIGQYLEKSQIKDQEYYYAPCSNKQIIKALIMNQLTCYDHGGDHEKALQWKKLYDLFVEEIVEDEED